MICVTSQLCKSFGYHCHRRIAASLVVFFLELLVSSSIVSWGLLLGLCFIVGRYRLTL